MSYHAMLKEARKERGLTLRAAAEQLGIAPSTLFRYEEGQILHIPEETLYKLLKIYDLYPEKELYKAEGFFRYERLRKYAESRQVIDADFLYKQYLSLNERGRSAVLSVLRYQTELNPSSARSEKQ